MTAPGYGPFETEQDARRAAHAVVPPGAGRVILSFGQNRELMRRALDEAGVETSPYEDGTLHWLGGWEDTTASVIAGWVKRAHEAGRTAAAPGDDAPRCHLCGALAEERPDPYVSGRMLWRHVRHPAIGEAAGFLDGDHDATPQDVLDELNDGPQGTAAEGEE